MTHQVTQQRAASRFLLFALLACTAVFISACSLFSADRPKPTPLDPVTPSIAGRQVWNARIDSVRFPLQVASVGGQFALAASDGTVLVVQADTGREVWRVSLGATVGAGVGYDGRFAGVVTNDGQLVVVEAGKVLWRKAVAARVTTSPLVAGERVFVLGVDRSVQAFDALDGRLLWTLSRPGDPLLLSQPGVLLAYKDTLVAGQGARLTGIDPTRGSLRWEVAVATPRGTNEVERLADLVGPALRVGNLICARSFQAAVGCVNADRGALLWSKTGGGRQGVAGDDKAVFSADATDRLTAFSASAGETLWVSDKLRYRDLSSPLLAGPTVVVGDGEGLVHWLSRDKGETLLRLPTDGSAIVAAPVISDTTVLIVTRQGGLFAFRPE